MRRHGPSSRVTSDLDDLRKGGPKYGDPVDQSPELHQQAILARAEARAFDGAPPLVPHPIDEQSAHSCISCHEQGLMVKDRRAPLMSHRFLDNCTACHVTVAPRAFGKAPELDNDFVGIESPGPGTRASEGAPPIIPHTTHMREKCAACHGLGGPEGIRTSHPELHSCTQCHAPATTELPWRL
jgi:cytochrome c-type protein NapB